MLSDHPTLHGGRLGLPQVLALAAALFLAVVAFGLYGPPVSATLHEHLMQIFQSLAPSRT